MRWPKKPTPCPDWTPYLRYTWTTAQVKAWLLRYGGKCLYNGTMYQIKKQNLGCGVYSITFKATDDWS